MVMHRISAALLFLLGSVGAGLAQDLTNAELLSLFENQRSAFRDAQDSSLGPSRSVTLMTIESGQATTLAPDKVLQPDAKTMTLEPSTGGTVTVLSDAKPVVTPLVDQAPTIDTAPTLVEPQPVVFGALAPELQVNLNIRFPFDSATLTPDQKPTLTQMCDVMKASDINLFRIVGHTDSSGTVEYNQALSQLRAEEVQRYLVTECGIAPARLEALGLGEQFLFDSKDPKAPANRRVEFQALS